MDRHFTTGQLTAVIAYESHHLISGSPSVMVEIPDDNGDPIRFYKSCGSMDEAKAEGKEIAKVINKMVPQGFMRVRRHYRPQHVAERNQVEATIREWAGPDAVIESMDD